MVNCIQCGNKLGKRQTKFCSSKCMGENQRNNPDWASWNKKPKIKRNCLCCGKEFSRHSCETKASKGKYCSQSCANSFQAKTLKSYVPLDISKITEVEIAYIAGIVDGEGHIAKPPSICVQITNTDKSLFCWMQKRINVGTIQERARKNENWKPVFNWRIRRKLQCYDFLRLIIPYLVIKKQVAQDTVDFIQQKYHLS